MSDVDSLFAWDADVGRLAQMRDRLRRHPRYGAAARRLAVNLLRDADEDPALEAMLRDAGHNVAALGAIYLHAAGEVTLARLKTFVAGFGLVSPGRARSLLSYMRHLQFLEADPDRISKRHAPYRVTPRFLASYTRHEASLIDAVCEIEPAARLLLRDLGSPAILNALVLEQGDAFAAGSDQARPFAAFYRVFLHRLAGIQILHDLVARAPAFPPRGDFPFSAPETALRFKVSRVHVARLMKEAADHGFVVLEPGLLRFTDAGLEAIAWLYASRLCLHLACAARVLKSNPMLAAASAAA